jgi:hypothetical protein
MTDPANATESRDRGFLAPKPDARPVDHCFRCGVATPVGQGLCDKHNPNRLPGPSSTQMHATIFGGILLGVIGFFLLASLAVGTTGPFAAEVTTSSGGEGGTAAISFTVTNEGETSGIADCRVTRDGVPRPDDLVFRSTTVLSGETMTFERQLAQPIESVGYDPDSITVICS